MRVHILVFGVLKDLIPESSAPLELPDGARVRDLLNHHRKSFASSDELWRSLAVAVNREYVSAEHLLRDGDEVALLPPVSGGTVGVAEKIALTRDRIDAHMTVTNLERPEDGALVIFDGVVRNNTRGRRTLYLVYEAYEEMALAQMRTLAVKAVADLPIRDCGCVGASCGRV
jgi:MoaE-MoaD fusion protein